MTVIDKRKLSNVLLSKGFELDNNDHAKFWFKRSDGKLCGQVWTCVSRGTSSKDLDNWDIGKISHQLKLTKKDFLRLYECPLKEPEYRQILKSQGIDN